jgi:hypothetical protein
MAAFTALAMGIGTALQVAGSMQAASAQKQMAAEEAAASRQAENAKQQQQQLDAQRRQRQAVRQMLQARAGAESAGANQGALYSSSVAGGAAQAVGEGSGNIQTANEARFIGGEISDANRAFIDARARGQEKTADAQSLSSLGGALVSLGPTIGRLGNFGAGGGFSNFSMDT